MPYYIYKFFEFPMKRVEKIEQHDVYKVSTERSKLLRRELALTEQCNVKMIYADNELLAEELLLTDRGPAPIVGDGDD